jgi:hypothetical protein
MVDYLVADAERYGATRILVVVGAGHKFALEDLLRARGYTIVDSRSFVATLATKVP